MNYKLYLGKPIYKEDAQAINMVVAEVLPSGTMVTSKGVALAEEGDMIYGVAGEFHTSTPDGKIIQTVWVRGHLPAKISTITPGNLQEVERGITCYGFDKDGNEVKVDTSSIIKI